MSHPTSSRKHRLEEIDALLSLESGVIQRNTQSRPIATRKTSKSTREYLLATEYHKWERMDGKTEADKAKTVGKAWADIPASSIATKRLKINGVSQDVSYLKGHHLLAPEPHMHSPAPAKVPIDAAALSLLVNVLSHARHPRAWFNVHGAYEYVPDTECRAMTERKKIMDIDGCPIPIEGMIFRIWDKYNDDKGHKYITRSFDYSALKIRFVGRVDTVWNEEENSSNNDGRVALDPTQMFKQYFQNVKDASVEWLLNLSSKERSLIGLRIMQTIPHVLDATRTFAQSVGSERQFWVLLLVLVLTPEKVVLKQLSDAGIRVRPHWYEDTLTYISSELAILYKIDDFQDVFTYLAGKLQTEEDWFTESTSNNIAPCEANEIIPIVTTSNDETKDSPSIPEISDHVDTSQIEVNVKPDPHSSSNPPNPNLPANTFVQPKRFVPPKRRSELDTLNPPKPSPASLTQQKTRSKTASHRAARQSPELGEIHSSSSSWTSTSSSDGFEIMETVSSPRCERRGNDMKSKPLAREEEMTKEVPKKTVIAKNRTGSSRKNGRE